MTQDRDAAHFRIDKRVPVAVLLTLGGMIAGGSWWMASLSDRLGNVESAVRTLEAANLERQQVATSVDARLAAIEAQLRILVNLMQQERHHAD